MNYLPETMSSSNANAITTTTSSAPSHLKKSIAPPVQNIPQLEKRRVLPSKSSPSPMCRQQMQERLYKLIQERCSVEDPTVQAKVLEQLLYRSASGDEDSYSKIMLDPSVITSKLKEVGTTILMRRLRKKQQKLGGFRSTMILTKLPSLPKLPVLPKENARSKQEKTNEASSTSSREKPVQDNDNDGDDEDSCYHTIPIASLKISNSSDTVPQQSSATEAIMDCDDDEGEQTSGNFAAV